MRIHAGETIVDLGCGNGGAGLWIARELGTKLIGIDLSAVGVTTATKRAAKLGLSERVHFQEGDITATGLSSASCDGAISLDVLALVRDKTAAINESRESSVLTRVSRSRPGNKKAIRRASMLNNLPIIDLRL